MISIQGFARPHHCPDSSNTHGTETSTDKSKVTSIVNGKADVCTDYRKLFTVMSDFCALFRMTFIKSLFSNGWLFYNVLFFENYKHGEGELKDLSVNRQRRRAAS